VDFLAGRDVGIEGVPDDGVRVFVTEVAKAIAFEPDFEAARATWVLILIRFVGICM
jgi:hypothetical protein